ncbi:hypothetical protein Q428_08085 [Fervidicella metallireducens AeB]|uniref:RNA-binding S4 domain-containing protein n=1 Tax=Fervidicella metallireducens AeB TaxID=1403537 RepID=A0A017RVL6_9CLOT|nr:YlmH/Sll1252 family protein [Fervidicella metallireducens]EYE88444.1 hypothetical protein Q428_08085 [Fervidicella metallireducens AeB]
MNLYITKNEEQNEKTKQLYGKIKRAKESWQPVFTSFLGPDEQILLSKMCESEDLCVNFFGSKGCFERAMAVISSYKYEGDIPLEVIKITANMKFEKLEHKDYFGTLLSLGIKKEKIGDINVYSDGAEIWISREISDYVCLNLNKIKHTGVKVNKIPVHEARERVQEFKITNVNVASTRLDCFVSEITGLSRSLAASKVKSGDVKLNHCVIEDTSFKVSEGDIISIRGFGRFIVHSFIKTSKSGRLVYQIKKYI